MKGGFGAKGNETERERERKKGEEKGTKASLIKQQLNKS